MSEKDDPVSFTSSESGELPANTNPVSPVFYGVRTINGSSCLQLARKGPDPQEQEIH
jgi:hypothetical protein